MTVMYMCLGNTQFVLWTDIHCTSFLTLNLASIQIQRELALFST